MLSKEDEDTVDTLIAISVVSKVLAKQIIEKEAKNEQGLQPDGTDDQSQKED